MWILNGVTPYVQNTTTGFDKEDIVVTSTVAKTEKNIRIGLKKRKFKKIVSGRLDVMLLGIVYKNSVEIN